MVLPKTKSPVVSGAMLSNIVDSITEIKESPYGLQLIREKLGFSLKVLSLINKRT